MNNQGRKNFIWNFIGITFNTFNSFIFSIIVNRINGIEIAGMFAYGYAIACLLWIVSIYFNRVYQVSSNIKDNVFIKHRYITCAAMFLLSIIVAILSTNNVLKLSIIILLCLFRNLEAVSDIYYGIYQKSDRLDYVGKSMFIKAIIGVLTLTIIDYITKNIVLGIIGLLIVNTIGTIVDKINCNRYLYTDKEENNEKENIKFIFKDALPIFLFSFLSILLLNMQKYVIGFCSTEEVQDIFNIIIMPATFMSLCGQYLSIPFMKLLNESYNDKKYDEFNKINVKIMIILLIIGIIVTAAMYILGIRVLEIIYNIPLKDYTSGICAIVVVSVFYALTAILSTSLTIMKKNNQQLIIYIITTLLSALLSFIFINKFGINGAVIAYCSSLIIQCTMYYACYKYNLVYKKENEKINENINNNSNI